VIGLSLTIPALLLIGYGHTLLPILTAALCFGFGFGMFDTNTMPILCQFVPPSQRATSYGFLNTVGISAGALITDFLGKSTDEGNLGKHFAILAGVVLLVVIIQLLFLRPKVEKA
jgi:MFS family permease